MAELSQQIIESFQHLPTGVEHPVALLGSAALAGAIIVMEYTGFQHTNEKAGATFSAPAVLELSAVQDADKNARNRMYAPLAATAGIGLLAMQFLGQPTYDGDIKDAKANVIVIKDMSNAMLHTSDLGQSGVTRAEAVNAGMRAVSFPGKLGIIQTGAKEKNVQSLTYKWEDSLKRTEASQVDPNGAQIVSALNLADTLLPTKKAAKHAKHAKHEGTVVIVSDGVVEDSPQEFANAVQGVKKNGVEVKVIVPGTADGKYQLPEGGQLVSGKVSPEVFKAVGAGNIIEAKDVASVQAALAEDLTSAGTKREHHNSGYPAALAVVALGFAVLKDKWQRTTRRI